MQLRAVVRRDDVIGLLEEITPLRVELSRRPQRAISIGRPTTLDFVPEVGIRVCLDARISWDVVGVTVPMTARMIRVLLTPKLSLREGHHFLSLEPTLEDFDLESLPFFADRRVRSAVNAAFERQRVRLTWDIEELLRFPLPEKVTPPMRVDLGITYATLAVDAESLILDVSFRPHGVSFAPRLRAVGDAVGAPASRR